MTAEDDEELKDVVRQVHKFATQERFRYKHYYRTGDFFAWDNVRAWPSAARPLLPPEPLPSALLRSAPCFRPSGCLMLPPFSVHLLSALCVPPEC